MISNYISIMM